MNDIPNELKITINTSIPGFQKVTYKPNMSIPNISKDDNSVQFNPLVKLDQSIINSVPENLRKREFFNKGLFQSLINYNHSQPVKSLLYATNSGIVDSNIKITLNTLFPENSVIYINKKPYTIADVQWSKGNWRIDTKYKPVEIDVSKISEDYWTEFVLYLTVLFPTSHTKLFLEDFKKTQRVTLLVITRALDSRTRAS
jgi:hypothetical protein